MSAKDFKSLNRIQKLAIVILAIGQDEGAKLLRQVPQRELPQVLIEMKTLTPLKQEVVDAVLLEFKAQVEKDTSSLSGGSVNTQELLKKAFSGSKLANLKNEFDTNKIAHIDAFDGVAPAIIYKVIAEERPQTQALVLANLESAVAAQVLPLFDVKLQSDILLGIANLAPQLPEAVEDLNQLLKKRVQSLALQQSTQKVGAKQAAKILAALDKDSQQKLFEQLGVKNKQTAERIKEELFTLEDLCRLSPRSFPLVQQKLAPFWRTILRGTSEELQNFVFANISQATAKQLREDLLNDPPLAKSQVQLKQREALALVFELLESGKIAFDDKEQYV